MKISEAKTKICPFMSGLGSGVSPSGDFLIDFEPVKCICGGCMAFVYTKQHSSTKNEEFTEKAGDVTYLKTRAKELPEDEKEGYCKRIEND